MFQPPYNQPQPLRGFAVNNWSGTYGGYIIPTTTEDYSIQATVDDGVVVTMDGFDVISSWTVQSPTVYTFTPVHMIAGVRKYIFVQYFHGSTDTSRLNLKWKAASATGGVWQIIPKGVLWH